MQEPTDKQRFSLWAALEEPLRGKTSLAKVFWTYGVLGSVLLSLVALFIDFGSELAIRTYSVLNVVFTVYVTVATYRCADNCRSKFVARMVRLSTLVAVFVILPLFAYLYFTGAFNGLLTTLPDEL